MQNKYCKKYKNVYFTQHKLEKICRCEKKTILLQKFLKVEAHYKQQKNIMKPTKKQQAMIEEQLAVNHLNTYTYTYCGNYFDALSGNRKFLIRLKNKEKENTYNGFYAIIYNYRKRKNGIPNKTTILKTLNQYQAFINLW